jgi:2'-hydroxyisoflavone reductase
MKGGDETPSASPILDRAGDEADGLPATFRQVRLLVIGGTQFVGRALVEGAVRRGHDVTIFHRGQVEPDDLPVVEHVHGDRHEDLDLVGDRRWDAVVDTHAYFPRDVREAGLALSEVTSHYTLVSSTSVHPDDAPAGSTEGSPTYPPLFDEEAELSEQSYGPLKVACEIEASNRFSSGCLIIRPGYLVGPHDPTDRFTWYLRRAASGGEMFAPGPPEAPLQVLDVRDLAGFMLDRIESVDSDVYGVIGPSAPCTINDVLVAARRAAGAETSFVWGGEELLNEYGENVSGWFPMWAPHFPGEHTYDASKAVRAGLRRRPLEETVADTLAWDEQRGRPELKVGLPSEMERELLGRHAELHPAKGNPP